MGLKPLKIVKLYMAAITLLFVLTACTGPELSTLGDEAEAARKVKVTEVISTSMGQSVKVEAAVTPSSSVQLAVEMNGKLQKKYVGVGEVVEQDQMLIELDPTEPRSALARAQLSKERVLIEFENAKLLLREDTQNSQLDLLNINLREADLLIEEAARHVQKTKLTSPISGVVVDIAPISIGQQVGPGQYIIQIEQLDPLYIEAIISEKDRLELQNKKQFPVYFPVLNQTLQASLLYIAPSNAENSNGFKLSAKLDNTKGDLHPGMSAQLILDESMAEKTLAVPIAAVLTEDGQPYVYKVSDNSIVEQAKVVTGRKNKEMVEIMDGLTEGDKIVIVGQSLLSDGNSVEIIE